MHYSHGISHFSQVLVSTFPNSPYGQVFEQSFPFKNGALEFGWHDVQSDPDKYSQVLHFASHGLH